MPTLKATVLPGEVCHLYYAKDVETVLRHGGTVRRPEIAGATADPQGLVTFNQPAGIEFLMIRESNGSFVKLMYSETQPH